MARALIIVESPAKTKTLKNFLGSDYQVEASMGHVRDLPEHRMGVDVENNFQPTYSVLTDRRAVLKRIQEIALTVDEVFLASDPDREGESIAWHLAEALKLKSPKRIQFNEITRQAVQDALQHPRTVNMDRVNAQQARRVLDRLIGYKLSPVLSRKIQKGLSAGRVQSVALRLICDREQEIQAFVPEEYWSLAALLLNPQQPGLPFSARLHSRAEQRIEPKTGEEISAILADLTGAAENPEELSGKKLPDNGYARYTVTDVTRRDRRRNPSPPFTTSTLQQDAARKLGFSNRRTMSVAQQLYEGIELGREGSVGLITYMRTDSVRIADEALTETRQYIEQQYGKPYLPEAPRRFKTRSEAQDAHEAIRPTSAARTPEQVAAFLESDQIALYRLIWQRFLACQMAPALLELTTVNIAAESERTAGIPYLFRATGSVTRFDGFTRVYTEGRDSKEASEEEQPPLPALDRGQILQLQHLLPEQHFTEPPPRYTEATIVKVLEELGIGRPSTYASTISVLRDREYVELRNKSFFPTDLGFVVTNQLVKHFPDVMNVKFTAEMETRLDKVEDGQEEWVGLVREFYVPFEQAVKTAQTDMESLKPAPQETEYHCPATGKVMLLRQGRYGPFISCSGYPECKKILKLNEQGQPLEGTEFTCGMEAGTAEKEAPAAAVLPDGRCFTCPDGKGVMLVRQSRYGPFLGCSSYPKCRTTLKLNADGSLLEGQDFACTHGTKRTGAARKTTVRKTTTGKKTSPRKPRSKPEQSE